MISLFFMNLSSYINESKAVENKQYNKEIIQENKYAYLFNDMVIENLN